MATEYVDDAQCPWSEDRADECQEGPAPHEEGFAEHISWHMSRLVEAGILEINGIAEDGEMTFNRGPNFEKED